MQDNKLSLLAKELLERLGEDQLLGVKVIHNQLVMTTNPDSLIKVMTILRDHSEFKFKQLTDICAVDYPDRLNRFEVVYHLLSLNHNMRLRVKVNCTQDKTIPSIIPVFPNANWYEREVWDLYGIVFDEHPDLRRIMTDYNFEGHPLRKDFPLTGYVEIAYDELEKKVVYQPVKLNQEYRVFDFLSPWEGMLGNYNQTVDPSALKVSSTKLNNATKAQANTNPKKDKS